MVQCTLFLLPLFVHLFCRGLRKSVVPAHLHHALLLVHDLGVRVHSLPPGLDARHGEGACLVLVRPTCEHVRDAPAHTFRPSAHRLALERHGRVGLVRVREEPDAALASLT